jgi:hypothetical protein
MAKQKINGDQIGTTGGVWQNYVPTFGGFSSTPTGYIARYTQMGKTVIVSITMGAVAPSNSTSLTITAPVLSANITNVKWFASAEATDNSATVNPLAIAQITANSTTITLYKDNSGAGFTASGNKSASFTLTYEAA